MILEREGKKLAETYPGLKLELGSDCSGLITGRLEVSQGVSYTVTMLVPSSYPAHEPILKCDPNEIPWKLHRHVYEKYGTACLCARSETRIHWPWGANLTDFFTKLVHPFFVGQFYYDTHGKWPPTGERSHGKAGIIETFVELLQEFGEANEKQIKAVLRLLARKSSAKGHEICPCGSGKKLRNCHKDLIRRLRRSIDPRHARLDLKEAFGISPLQPK